MRITLLDICLCCEKKPFFFKALFFFKGGGFTYYTNRLGSEESVNCSESDSWSGAGMVAWLLV